ncbi:MAG TPA: hypothetical protein VN259_09920, partial [Xanthomonadales bacterium]|nr:hypothetical protein [Xanthomonadales bacterium]
GLGPLSPNITQVIEKQYFSAKDAKESKRRQRPMGHWEILASFAFLASFADKKQIAALAHKFDTRISAPAGATKTLIKVVT